MSAAPPARVVVVGGGITGLTAAYSLTPAGRALADPAQRDGAAPPGPPHPAVEVLVLESDDRLGGKIRTTDFAGHPVDEGADSFITRTPAAIELCRRLDIGPLVSPAQNGAFVVRTRRRTRLLRMPAGLVLGVPTSLRSMAALAGSGIVSARGVGRAALDLVRRDDWPGTEETVGEMVSRRLGSEMSQSLVGPLLGAVNAGDVDELEAVSAVPQLGEAARRGGSLMLALRRRPTAGTTVWPAGAFADWATARPAGSADASEPVFAGLRDGLGALPDALAARLRSAGSGAEIRTGVTVGRVAPAGGSTGGRTGDLTGARPLRLTTTDGEVVDADAVVVTAPAPAAASLLADAAPRTAALLRRIEYASVAVVTLGFARSQIRHRLDAAGMIVAAGEGLLTTACSFASSKWPHWADADEVVLRASVGRHGDGRAVSMDDDELVAAVRDELAPLLGITGEPARRRVSRWHHALPQYFRGHRSLVAEIESCLADETAEPSPGRVVLAGAAYRGLGVPACIAQAEAAAAAVLAALAGEERRQSAP